MEHVARLRTSPRDHSELWWQKNDAVSLYRILYLVANYRPELVRNIVYLVLFVLGDDIVYILK